MAYQFNQKPKGSLIGSGSYQFRHYGDEGPAFQFLCCGSAGSSVVKRIPQSLDGTTWILPETTFDLHLLGIVYANGHYTTVGSKGTSYLSTDGNTWTAISGLDTARSYYCVVYLNGLYICAGASGYWAISTDGTTWTQKSRFTSASIRDIAYGNNMYVCVTQTGYIYYSSDLVTWTKSNTTSGKFYFYGIVYADNKFVASGGYSYYSTDGINWTLSSTVAGLGMRCVTYGNGRFVEVGTGGTTERSSALYSLDGITWTTMNNLPYNLYPNKLVYGHGRFVCVGLDGISYYSTDGLSWNQMTGLDTSVNYMGLVASPE